MGSISGVGPVLVNLSAHTEFHDASSVGGSCFLGEIGGSTRVSGKQDADGKLHLEVLEDTKNAETTLATIEGRIENAGHAFQGIWMLAGQSNSIAFRLDRVAQFKELV